MSTLPARRWLLFLLLVPVLLLGATLRVSLGAGGGTTRASGTPQREQTSFASACQFPGQGADRKRLVVVAVDSLRAETAFDPQIMPWLSAHRSHALWGRMQPCISQLSLLCFRTMFEGAEPLLVTGFHNYTGMSVASDNLIQRLAQRGIRVAAIADIAFVSLYADSLAARAQFEDRPPEIPTRDAFGRAKTFEWLADPTLDVIVSHVIDTDATSHRVGIGHPEYVAKFRETDDFLKAVHERLGPNDSLIVLGDHGHDAHGYHSTGIPSQTAYFASGPLFPRGKQHDTLMATTLFLMGAVSCEPVSDSYQGTFPIAELVLPEAYRALQRRVESNHAPLEARTGASPVAWELPAVGILLVVILLLVRAREPGFLALTARRGVLSSLTLLPSLLFPHPALLWASALAVGASVRRSLLERWRVGAPILAGFAFIAAVGASAHVGLVTLQNHVNARWTIGFWCALALAIAIGGQLLARATKWPLRQALGVAAALGMFLLLAFGPYYYGTARNLLYGTTWLLLSHTVELVRRDRKLVGFLALAVLPLVPLYAPILKEWQPTYPLLAWFAPAQAPARVAVAALAFVPLWLVAADAKRRLRLGLILAASTGLALLTDLGPIPWLNATLLLLSYVGFMAAAERAERELPSPSVRYLVPLGQATYAFMAFFVLLGALRFANVDYRFALELTPIEQGEGKAALVALPIVTAKYVVPICLMLLAGPALRLEALTLVLLKAGCLAAGLIGFELARRAEARLFLELQTQETALVAVLYMTLLSLFWLTGSSEREPVR